MTLLDIRQKFVELSGRYDLVVDATSYVDAGADFFIKAGQRWLDRQLEFPKRRAELTVSVATDDTTATLSNVQSVQQVMLRDSTDGEMVYLNKLSLRELREVYGGDYASLEDITPGQPVYCALGLLRTNGTTSSTTEQAKMLVFAPPADRAYELVVDVILDSLSLSADSSYSYWSLEHPDLLVLAGLHKLEQFYRNREGAAAYQQSLMEALVSLDNEVVEQDIAETGKLQSSWRFIDEPLARILRITS